MEIPSDTVTFEALWTDSIFISKVIRIFQAVFYMHLLAKKKCSNTQHIILLITYYVDNFYEYTTYIVQDFEISLALADYSGESKCIYRLQSVYHKHMINKKLLYSVNNCLNGSVKY